VAPNQVTIKKLDEEQTRNMVKNAATKPDIRRQKIMDAVIYSYVCTSTIFNIEFLQFNSLRLQDDPCLNEFGIRVNGTMKEVEGRVLSPPSLQYFNAKEVRVKDGVWNPNAAFQQPGTPINTWAIIDLCNCLNGRR